MYNIIAIRIVSFLLRFPKKLPLWFLSSLLVFFVALSPLQSQTTILSDPGMTYTDANGPTGPDVYPVDVSNCTSISFSVEYSFSLPWEGDGNMEYCNEVSPTTGQPVCFGAGPCACDPANPTAGGCNFCWDFLWIQFHMDGSVVGGDLIGDAGTTDAEQFGVINSGPICTNGASMADITAVTQTWASNESVTFTNLVILCWEGVPTITSNASICPGDNLNLSGTVTDPTVVTNWLWTNSGAGIIASPNSQTTFATNAQNGEIYTLTTTDVNGCTASDMITVSFLPSPTANPGIDLQLCENPAGSGMATFDLTTADAGVSGGVGTVSWYLDMAATIPIPTPTAFTASNNTSVFATVSNGGCESLAVEVTLIVNPGPTANAGPSFNFCATGSNSFSLSSASASAGGSISWTSSGTGTFSNPTIANPNYTPSAADILSGSVDLTITVSVGGCPDAVSFMTLTFGLVSNANPGGPYSICEGDIVSLSGTANPAGATINWTSTGDGFFDDPTNPNTNYNPGLTDPANSPITVTLTTSDPSGICGPSMATTTITINPAPNATQGLDLQACENPLGSGLAVFNLTTLDIMVSGGAGTVTWYSNAAATILVPDPTNFPASNNTIVFATVTSGTCESSAAAVTLIVSPGPSAEAGNPIDFCADGTNSFTLATASAINGSIFWTTSGSGIFSNSIIPNPNYTPSIADIIAGSVDLTITVSAPGCPDAIDFVTITFGTLLTADAGGPYAICAGNPVAISGMVSAGNIGSWTSSGDGTFDNPGNLNTNYNPGPGDPFSSPITLTLTATDPSGICPPVTSDAVLDIEPGPIPTSGVELTLCEDPPGSGTATFDLTSADLLLSGGIGTVTWYSDIAGTLLILDPVNFSAPNNTRVYARLSDGVCESAPEEVLLTVTVGPSAAAGNDLDFCATGNNAISLSTATALNGTILWTTSGTGIFSDATIANPDYTPSFADILAGSVNLTITVSNTGCTDASDFMVLTFGNSTNANAGGPYTTCEGASVALSASIGAGADGNWTSAGDGTFDNSTNATTNYNPGAGDISAGMVTLTFTATDPSGICPATTSTTIITISAGPSISIDPVNDICEGELINLTAVLGGSASTLIWTTGGDGIFSSTTDLNTTYTPGSADISGGSVTITATTDDVGGSCTAAIANITITIIEAPYSGLSGLPLEVCSSSMLAIDLNNELDGEDSGGTWAEVSLTPSTGGAFISSPGSFNPNGQLAGIYSFEYTVTGNPPCPDATTTVTINVVAEPSATVTTNATICNLSAQGSVLDFDALVTAGDMTGSWADTDGSSVNLSNTTSVNFNGIAAGTYTFTYTTNSATAPCVEQSYELEILVRDCACPNTATNSPGDLCNDNGSLDLSTLVVTTEPGSWMITNTPAGSNPATLSGSIFDAGGADTGDYTLTYTIDLAPIPGCPDSSVQIITVFAAPNAGTPEPTLELCNTNTSVILLNDRITGEDSGGIWMETSAIPSTGGAFSPAPGSFNPDGQATGLYTFQYIVNGTIPCPNAASMVTINITAVPFATVATNATICNLASQGAILDFDALVSAGDLTGSWADTDGSSVNLSNTAAVDFDGIAMGTYTFTYTTNSATAPCVEQSYQVEVLVQDCACPDVSTIAPADLCNANGSLDLTTLVSTTEPGSWMITATPAGSNPATLIGNFFDAAGADPGDYEITYTIDLAPISGCPDSSVQIITVYAEPAATVATSATICNLSSQGSTINFDALVSAGDMTGSWADTDGSSVNLSNTASVDFNGIGTGTYTFTYTTNSATAPCTERSYQLEVLVIDCACPDVSTLAPSDLCNNNGMLDLATLVATTEPGSWMITNTPAGGSPATLSGTIFNATGADAGDYEITYTIDLAPIPNCLDSSVQVLTVFDAPSAGTPEPALELCNSSTNIILLNDQLNNEDSGGIWSEISGTPSTGGAFNAGAGTFDPSGQNAGIYIFQYFLNGMPPCANTGSNVTITIMAEPSATLNPSANICNLAAQGSLLNFDALITAGDMTGTWTDTDGSGVNLSNTAAVDFDGLPMGSYTFTYTTNSATAPCTEQSYDVEVFVSDCACPSVATIAPGDLCNTNGNIDLSTLVATPEPGTWAITNTPAGSNPATLTGTFFDASGADAGDYEITYTLNQAPIQNCPDSSVQIISVFAAPNAGIDNSPISFCNNSATIILLNDLLIGEDLAGTWTEVSAIPSTGTAFDATAGSFIPMGQNPGTYAFQYLVIGNPVCGNAMTTVSVILEERPAAIVHPDTVVCNLSAQGSILNFNALVTGGDLGGSWTDSGASGVNLSNTASVDFNGILPGTYTFTYTTNSAISPCSEQSYSMDVTVQDCACPSLSIIPPAPLCNNENLDLNSLLVTTEPGTWAITNVPPGSNPASLSGSLFFAIGADPGIYEITFTLDQVINGCPSSATQNLVVSTAPDAGTGTSLNICNPISGDVVTLFNLISGGDVGGIWAIDAGSPNVPNAGTFDAVAGTFMPFGNTSGTYQLIYAVTGSPFCPANATMVTIELANVSVAIAGNLSFCSGSNTELSATPGYANYTWSVVDSLAPTLIVNTAGNYSVTVSDALGCSATDQTTVIELFPATGSLDTTLCPGDSLTINGRVYNSNNPVGTETFIGAASNACDSILSISVGYYPDAVYLLQQTLCPDEVLTINGNNYDINRPSGIETLSGAAAHGCDSTIVIDLSFTEELTAGIRGIPVVCKGDSTSITFNFTGPGPFDVTYSVNSSSVVLTGINDGATITVLLNNTTTFILESVVSTLSICPVLVPNNSLTVEVTEVALMASVSSDYDGYGVSCRDAENGILTADATMGTGPYSYAWDNGSSGAVLENVAAGDYRVVTTDANGCTSEAVASLSAPPDPILTTSTLSPTCFGDTDGSVIITAIDGVANNYSFSIDGGLFQPATSLPFLLPGLAAGNYSLTIADETDCRFESDITIPSPPEFGLDLGTDQVIELGDSILLDPVTNMEVATLEWTPPVDLTCLDCLNPYARPFDTQIYSLTIWDSLGCAQNDEIMIQVRKDIPVYIPNVFSPNADGTNDFFFIQTGRTDIHINSLRIYDRWGGLVFGRSDFAPNAAELGWDGTRNGTSLNPAVFVYVVELEYVNGQQEIFSGDITLVK